MTTKKTSIDVDPDLIGILDIEVAVVKNDSV
jgi:hypothetical protein